MAFTNTKESGLEALIVKWLVEQNDYEQGTNADYNRDYALTRLVYSAFFRIRSRMHWINWAYSKLI